MERNLTDKDIMEMDQNYKGEENRKRKDRRVAINSCMDPELDRRSGHDRRRNR